MGFTPHFQPLRLLLVAVAAVSCAGPAWSQESREQLLERRLQERDRVIRELLERVEALERRVGVQPAEAQTGRPAGPDAAPVDADATSAGAKPAPGTVVVEEGAAERALERSLTRAGALLLSPGVLEVEPGITFARREDATPAFVSSGGLVLPAETERNANSLTADLAFRVGLPWDSQFELGIPYRWREVETVTAQGFTPIGSSTDSGGGAGDVRIGLAKTLLREGLWRPDLVGRITWDTDTGRMRDDGVALGGGSHEVQASLSAIKRQDPIAFVGGLAYEYGFEKDDIRPGPTVSGSFGSFVALSPETSVRFLLSGGYQAETEFSGTQLDGSDRVLGTFVVGGTTLLGPGTLLNFSAGIGLTDDSDDLSLTLSLPIRFGGL